MNEVKSKGYDEWKSDSIILIKLQKTQQKRNSIASISSIISSSDSGESEFDDEFYRNYQQKPIPMHLFKDRIKVISNCDNNIRENDFNMGTKNIYNAYCSHIYSCANLIIYF